MYLSFYGLKRKPFQISTNPSFVWLGDTHKEALALLKYGILENQGFLLLTGDVGTGKTTLINALTNSLDNEFIVAKVPDPGMETIDFMNYISHAFDMKKKFVSKDAFLIHFGHFLNSAYAAGKKVLLIIDEAQRLSSDLLEEVRQLSNIENRGTKLLNIFLIGQNEFNDILQESQNRALYQRISVNFVIKPLDVHETEEFIRHRLKIAGSQRDIFHPDAIRAIYEFSGGLPRRVNIICDHALLSGFSRGVQTVTRGIVRKCAKDLCLPGSFAQVNGNSFSSEVVKATSPERLQNVGSSNLWRTGGIFLLVVMVVFVITIFNSPREYRDLFYLLENSGMQVSNVLPEISVSDSGNYSETDLQTASVPLFDTQAEMLVSDEVTVELSVANGQSVKNVEHVSEILEIDSTNILDQMASESVQREVLPSTQPINKDGADDANSADIQTDSIQVIENQSEMLVSDEVTVELSAANGQLVNNVEHVSEVLEIDSTNILDQMVSESVQREVLPSTQLINKDGADDANSADIQTDSVQVLETQAEMLVSDEDTVELSVANGQLVNNVEQVSDVLEIDNTNILYQIAVESVQREVLPSNQSIKKDGADDANSADMQTDSIQVIETQTEMLVSNEVTVELSVAKGQLAKNVEHVSEVLEIGSTNFPHEISTGAVYPAELPSTQPIKKNIVDEGNSADIALSQFYPQVQQTVIDEDVAKERRVSSAKVVEVESEVGPVQEKTAKTENIVMLEKSVLNVDIPVAETEKTDVIYAFGTSTSGESGNESEESIEIQTASSAFLAIKEDVKQSKSDDVPDEPVKRIVPGEAEEIINGVSENVDPSAVIDWVLKNRSE